MSDPLEIQKLLTAEVREALNELRGFPKAEAAAQRRERVNGNGVEREVAPG